MKIEKFPIPHTSDPFVNTPLINAGFDPQTREERFWISTWNGNVGCLGALVTPGGKSRIYRFKKQDGLICCGAYSACLTDNDTIWLISDLQAFVKLTLSTGEYEVFRTGAPSALVFAGAQYDKHTNKLLAGAFVPPDMHVVSFDINTKTSKIFNNFTKASVMRSGFPIGDGTYGFCVLLNESGVYRWDPAADEISKISDCKCDNINAMTSIACDGQGRNYIHGKGWIDADAAFDDSCIADEELLFFGCIGDTVYGTRENVMDTDVCSWNSKTGEIKTIFTTTDNSRYNITSDGKLIGVSRYGELTLHTTEGELLLSTMLDSDSPNTVDCMIRVNDELVLGTPFISQRFWVMNTDTGEGMDAGRASPGGGEVLRVWAINGKAYMASYTEGVLTEFDPKKPMGFPENPKILCQPKNSMRPIANTAIGDEIFYASTHHYGELGCEITRYNISTGEEKFADDPIPGHALASMCLAPDKSIIISSTTYEADCCTAPPVSDECYITELCPESLEIVNKVKVPVSCTRAVIIGCMDAEHMLCEFHVPNDGKKLGVYNWKERSIVELDSKISASAQLHCAGDNLFVLFEGGRISLARVEGAQLKSGGELLVDEEIYRIFVYPEEIFAATPTQMYTIKDYLA